jgi:hypothetical protein
VKSIIAFRYPILPILISAVIISSCAGFKEAYEDRVCWDGVSSVVPLQCDEVFINFRCPEDLTSLSSQLITTNRKIVIKQVVGYSAPKVGELFSHDGSIPIFVKK